MRISDIFANYWVHIGSIIGSILKPQTSLKTSHFLLNDAIFFYQCLTNFYRCNFLSMFEKDVKHRANDASNDGHRPTLMLSGKLS